MRGFTSVFFLLLLSTSGSNAAESPEIRFECATQPLSTSFRAVTNQGTVTLTVIHHHGGDYIPISSRVLVARDLSETGVLAGLVKQLGTAYSFTFPAGQCAKNAADQMNCFGSSTMEIGGIQVSNVNFYTSKVTQEFYGGVYTNHAVNLSFFLNSGQYYSVTLPFEGEECRFH